MDVERIVERIYTAVTQYQERKAAELLTRLVALESRTPRDGIDGKDGASVSLEDLHKVVLLDLKDMVSAAIEPEIAQVTQVQAKDMNDFAEALVEQFRNAGDGAA